MTQLHITRSHYKILASILFVLLVSHCLPSHAHLFHDPTADQFTAAKLPQTLGKDVRLVDTLLASKKPPPPKKQKAATSKKASKVTSKKRIGAQKRKTTQRITKPRPRSTNRLSSAKSANKRLKGLYSSPPYKRGTLVKTRYTTRTEKYIRVYGGNSTVNGKFLMKAKDIKGMTAKQIQNKYGLKNTPTHFVRVSVPPGTKISSGIAAAKQNPNFPRTQGGGRQYELRSKIVFPKKGIALPAKFER